MPDADLLPLLLVLWIVSAARVLLGLVYGERQPPDLGLATLAMVFVPWLCRDAIGWWRRRLAARLRSRPASRAR